MYRFCKTFLITLLLLLGKLQGQINMDSAIKKLETLPNDTNSINIITRQGIAQRKINLDNAITFYNLAYERSRSLNNKYMIARTGMLIASAYGMKSEFEKESTYIAEAKKIAEELGDKGLLIRIYITLANMYSYNGQTRKAVEIYEKALKLCNETHDDSNKASIYNNLGGITYRESQLNIDTLYKAISYIKLSIRIIEEKGLDDDLVSKYSNLGLMYCDVNKLDSALIYVQKAREAMKGKELPDDMITYYSYLGRIYTDQKKYDLAEKNYFLSM
jgi:tetratricopeptide (TPR) repeat protein